MLKDKVKMEPLTSWLRTCGHTPAESPSAVPKCGATLAVLYIQERMCCMYGWKAAKKRNRTSGAARGSDSCSSLYKYDSRAGPLGKPQDLAHVLPKDCIRRCIIYKS